jgi:hypothetical protein
MNQELLNKLQKQSTLSGGRTVDDGGFDLNPNANSNNNIAPTPTGSIAPGQFLDSTQSIARNQMTPKEESVEAPINEETAETGVPPVRESTAERIRRVKEQLGEAPQLSNADTMTARAKAFLDEFGNETFYVKNVSDGHVVMSHIGVNIGSLEGTDIVVKRGMIADLLEYAALEDIKKSRDVKTMCAGKKPKLQRLTPEEFAEEGERIANNKVLIDEIRANQIYEKQMREQQQNPNARQNVQRPQSTSKIRPIVLSKLEKLRISSDSINAHLGMTPVDFAEWAVTENLNIEELEFLATHPFVIQYNDVRAAVYDRIKDMQSK